jgi:hypothetical protein
MALDLLHAFARWLEDFSGRHSHTIALLEAVSTTAAVIVALTAAYAAKRVNRPRLTAVVSVMQIIHGDGRPISEAPTYIAVRLTNVGMVPIRLHSNLFSWSLPFEKTAWLAMPVDESGDGHVTQRRYPFVLLPRTSETVFFTAIDRFKTDMPRILGSGRFGRKISAKLLRGIVYTDDGSRFRASFDGSFRKELAALV